MGGWQGAEGGGLALPSEGRAACQALGLAAERWEEGNVVWGQEACVLGV